jgi:hypothetical protein
LCSSDDFGARNSSLEFLRLDAMEEAVVGQTAIARYCNGDIKCPIITLGHGEGLDMGIRVEGAAGAAKIELCGRAIDNYDQLEDLVLAESKYSGTLSVIGEYGEALASRDRVGGDIVCHKL